MSRFSVGKLRAALGVSAVGGFLGGLLGGVVLGVSTILAPEAVPLSLALGGMMAMAAFGAYSFAGFALLLAGTEGAGEVDKLSILRSAARGLVAGASFPVFGALVTAGALFPFELAELLQLAAVFGTLGAGGAGAIVAVAKSAGGSERAARLATGSPSPQVTEGGGAE